jgi:DNA-binding MarR family transcriptional regulator
LPCPPVKDFFHSHTCRLVDFETASTIMTSNIFMSRQNSLSSTRRSGRAGEQRQSDSIELLLSQWKTELPDLDSWPFAIFGRIWKLSANLMSMVEGWLKPLGLTFETFSVIVTLRRIGAPYELNPTTLYRESLLSSGAMTNRIDRAEKAGLVKRIADPNDRRGTLVRLTPKGLALADQAIRIHFSALASVFSDLDRDDRKQLAGLLAKLLSSIERDR